MRMTYVLSVALAGLIGLALSSAPAAAAGPQKVSIDAAKTGEPMSPYIFGQFTEHLGRCIYGGIWAQMLEDRKFYYPVADKFAQAVRHHPGVRQRFRQSVRCGRDADAGQEGDDDLDREPDQG